MESIDYPQDVWRSPGLCYCVRHSRVRADGVDIAAVQFHIAHVDSPSDIREMSTISEGSFYVLVLSPFKTMFVILTFEMTSVKLIRN